MAMYACVSGYFCHVITQETVASVSFIGKVTVSLCYLCFVSDPGEGPGPCEHIGNLLGCLETICKELSGGQLFFSELNKE